MVEMLAHPLFLLHNWRGKGRTDQPPNNQVGEGNEAQKMKVNTHRKISKSNERYHQVRLSYLQVGW